MNIKHLNNRFWYLARYNTVGKNRESLFSWLNEQNVIPWTPLIIKRIRRTDSRYGYRKKTLAIFPGYFFIQVNFDLQPVSVFRRHSAFIDFVKFGGEIKPVNKNIIEGLMKVYPNPVLNSGAGEELNTSSNIRLTKAQYQYLLRMENSPQPESRITWLLELVSNAENYGFTEHSQCIATQAFPGLRAGLFFHPDNIPE